jgi:hypothetical protein
MKIEAKARFACCARAGQGGLGGGHRPAEVWAEVLAEAAEQPAELPAELLIDSPVFAESGRVCRCPPPPIHHREGATESLGGG